jgi:hypothetical protein
VHSSGPARGSTAVYVALLFVALHLVTVRHDEVHLKNAA